MRQYETVFLISPNLEEEETAKIITQIAGIVTKNKGKLIQEDRWGKKKLAYPIKKFEEAFYVFFHYEGESNIPFELEKRFKQTEPVLRFLTVKKEIRENMRKKRKGIPAEEEVAVPAVEEEIAAPAKEEGIEEEKKKEEIAAPHKEEKAKKKEKERIEQEEEITPLGGEEKKAEEKKKKEEVAPEEKIKKAKEKKTESRKERKKRKEKEGLDSKEKTNEDK